MADAFRGLTLRIGADARPLKSAIDNITRSAGQAQKQMNRLNKALKFDKSNAAIIESKLDLMGDKALHSARAVAKIRTSMKQAAQSAKGFNLEKVANETKNAYAATQKLRDEYNHVDASLQHIYDAVGRVVKRNKELSKADHALAKVASRLKGLSDNDALAYVRKLREQMKGTGDSAEKAKTEFKKLTDGAHLQDAVDHVKKLRQQMRGVGPEADKAAAEFKRLMTIAATDTGINKKFGQQKGDVEALAREMDRLVDRHKKLNAEYHKMETVQGYRAMAMEAQVFESEVRQAATEAARLRTEMHALGTGGRLAKDVADIRQFESASERAVASAKQMVDAYRAVPNSLERFQQKVLAVRTAEASLKAENDAIRRSLKRIESDPAFDKVAASSEKAYLNAVKLERKYAELTTKLNLAEGEADQLALELKTINTTGGKEEADRYRKLYNRLREVKQEAKEAKTALAAMDDQHATSSLIVEQRRLHDQLAKNVTAARNLHTQMSKLTAIGTAGKSLRQFGFGMYASVTPTVMMLGRYMIQAAEDTDAAFRDMRKTVNGSDEEFQQLLDHAIEFSKTHVTSANTMLEIEAMGGQLGIQVENLEAFAHTVSNLDIATNMDADDIAEQLGKMATVLGINEEEYDNFGDALVRLGNNMPVMEGDIMNLTTRFMGMGKVVGMQPDEMLAWAAAASATGMKAEAAGSSMQRYISKMETAVTAGGEDLEAWAKVAGMSGEEFAKLFGEDSSAAMYAFVDGLGMIQKNGGSVNQTLMELGINNVRDKQLLEGLAVQMANAGEEGSVLAQCLQMANDAYNGMPTNINGKWEQAGDAMREADKKSEGFSGSVQKMRNQATALMVELGDAAKPMVDQLGGIFEKLTSWFSSVPRDAKTFALKTAGAFAAFGPATVALGTFMQSADAIGTKAVPAVKGGLMKVGNSVANFGAKMSRGSTAVMKLGLAISSLGSTGGMVGIAAAAIAIKLVVDAIQDYVKKQQDFKAATEGMGQVTERFASLNKGAAADLSNYNEEVGRTSKSYDELTESIADSVREQNEHLDAAQSDIGKLAAAQQVIDQYANTDLSGNVKAQGELIAAVQAVNDVCGTQWQVIDVVKGKLADETGAIMQTKDALDELIDAKQQSIQMDLLSESISDNLTQQDELLATLQDEQKALDDLYAQRENSGYGPGGANEELNNNIRTQETRVANLLAEYEALSGEYDVLTTQLGNVSTVMTETTHSVESLANGNSTLMSLFGDDTQGLAVFAASLQDAGMTIDEFNSIESMQWYEAKRAWDAAAGSGKEVDAVMEALGLHSRTLAEQYSAEMQSVAGSTDAWEAAIARTGMTAESLSSGLREAGISAADFAQVGQASFDAMWTAAGEDMSTFKTELDFLNSQGINLQEANINVNDEGLLTVNDRLMTIEGNIITLDGQSFTVTADGNFEQVIEESDEAQEGIDALDGETAETSADMDTTDADAGYDEVMAEAEEINDTTATMSVDVDSEALREVLGSMLQEDGMTINASFNLTSNGVDEAMGQWNELEKAVSAGATGDVKVTYDTVVSATEQVGRLSSAVSSVPSSKSVWISVTGGALWEIENINSALRNMTTYKEITIHTKHTNDGKSSHAAGGIFRNAAGGFIPRNAVGALNGIVRRATLTNIGWVGEAGAEAVMHMRNAGGAVIPLSNHRYVRPFARAVATEMAAASGNAYGYGAGPTYNTTINTTGDGEQLARTLTGAFRTYSRIHGGGR